MFFLIPSLLGITVFLRDKKAVMNRVFFLLTISVSVWAFANLMPERMTDYDSAMAWIRITFLASAYIPLMFYYFFRTFPENISLTFKDKSFFCIPVILSFLFIFTDLLVSGITDMNIRPYPVGYGPLFIVYGLYFLFFILYGFYIIFKKLFKSSGLAKAQLWYLVCGFLFAIIFSATTNLILPMFGNTKWVLLGSYSTVIFFGVTAYAIIRHRLMDIRMALVKSIVFSFIILSISSLYILLVYFLRDPIVHYLEINFDVFLVLAAIIISFGLAPFRGLIEKETDKLFFKGRYDSTALLRELGDLMKSTLDLDLLASSLLKILKDNLRISGIGLYILENSSAAKDSDFILFKSINIPKGKYQKEIVEMADESGDMVIADELPGFMEGRNVLRNHGIGAVLPLKVQGKMIGFLVLGEKKSGDMFTSADINFLSILAAQSSTAISNAIAYKEVIRDKEKIKRLLGERKKLDALKDEFISIASHEVNTPLTIAQGYLSLILEHKEVKKNKEVNDYANSAFEGMKRINALLTTLMSASKIISKNPDLHKEYADFPNIVKEETQKFDPYAEIHNIDFAVRIPKEKVPKIKLDVAMMREVIYGLLDNAFKFTPPTKYGEPIKNSIAVSLLNEKGKVTFRVKDTGEGIDKKTLPHIFEKFYQEDSSFTRSAQGMGLGLYISQEILKFHDSKLFVKSEKGKGSEFWFSLEYN